MSLRLPNPAARLTVLAIAVPPAAAALASDRQVRFGLRLTRFSDSPASGSTDSRDSRATKSWIGMGRPWTSGKDLHHVHTCVLRNFSRGLGTRIQSIAWIDDISFSLGTPNP
jgi:hypothetical protein